MARKHPDGGTEEGGLSPQMGWDENVDGPVPMTGADVVAYLDGLGLAREYGDPAIDSPDLARQLSSQMSHPNREND